MGYQPEQVEAIVAFIGENGHVIDAPGLKQEHYEVFDTAMGARSLKPMGHVRMMAAIQPFISGAISKTVNMPEAATVSDVEEIYYQGWKLGLKALAIYRDNCKVGQPLSASKGKADVVEDDTTTTATATTMIELACETDFVAKNDKFIALADTVVSAVAAAGSTTVEEALAAPADGRTVREVIEQQAATLGEKVELVKVNTDEGNEFDFRVFSEGFENFFFRSVCRDYIKQIFHCNYHLFIIFEKRKSLTTPAHSTGS
jgi:ribonucleotide reductase alpha subunit